jgi:hypothetical protein
MAQKCSLELEIVHIAVEAIAYTREHVESSIPKMAINQE